LFANTDWYLFNFRRALADAIIARGDQVILVSPAGKYSGRLLEAGYDWRVLNFGGRDKSILKLYRLFRDIRKIYAEEKPDLVHHFTIKCVLFGGLAARLQGVRAVHAVTGMGHVFTDSSLFMWLARMPVKLLYRFVCRHSQASVVFQNHDDMDYFVNGGLVNDDRAYLIRGSGVDCCRFCPSEKPREPGGCRLLFASRLLKEKGVWELVDAVKQLRSKDYAVELLLAGEIYPGNPSSLTKEDIEQIATLDGVTVLGHVDDMAELFHKSDVVVLPSYREGTPRVLLEAGASGKPLIATDIAGCRGVVIPGENGELISVGDISALKNAVIKLLDIELQKKYGRRSREIIVEIFGENKVIEQTLKLYKR
jgi:glycosyltransferase involved in cell wall biosynthesis